MADDATPTPAPADKGEGGENASEFPCPLWGGGRGGGTAGRQDALRFLAVLVFTLAPTAAFAHASDRGHVLLLPTGHYLFGGALAVLASFLVLVAMPARQAGTKRGMPLGSVSDAWRLPASLASFAVFASLIAAGLFGSRDPLSNPLPLVVWTLVWVGLMLVQGLFGNLWSWINPWYGPWRLATVALGRAKDAPPPFSLPDRLGLWPAVILFLGFAWFELIYPAPDDPWRLAVAGGGYWCLSFLAMLLFGHDQWSRRGEFLSVVFGMVARFGVVQSEEPREGRRALRLVWPGARLATTGPLPPSGAFFLLAVLGSVSFDGFAKTFVWLGANGINPLEFPGRTALTGINSLGLAGAVILLSGAFFICVLAGEWLAGSRRPALACGLLVWSIVPIALAYHLSHYLTLLLVNAQYALVALSDPFSLGWNLFGTAYLSVGAGIVMGSSAAFAIWNAQAAAIVGGHVLAVLTAHRLAVRLHGTGRAALLSQLPLTVLMIGYTVFGLWLLSTPTGG